MAVTISMSLTVYREELSWTNNLQFVIQSYAYGSIADAKGIELQTQPGNRVIVPIRLTGRDEFLRDSAQRLKLRTGCGYFIPMNHPAGLKLGSRSAYHVLQFTVSSSGGPDLFAGTEALAVLRLPHLIRRLAEIQNEKDPTRFALSLQALAADFTWQAARRLGTSSAEAAKLYECFAPEMNYLARHLSAKTRVADLAAVRHQRRDAFTRAFIRQTGNTPKDVIDRRLLDRALQLIAEGKMHTDEIAYALGFSSAGNFTRFFKRLTGYPPVRYRRRNPVQTTEIPSRFE